MRNPASRHMKPAKAKTTLEGNYLSLKQIVDIAQNNSGIALTSNPEVLEKIFRSYDYIQHSSSKRKPIYGVNTQFGGMANQILSLEETQQLQTNLLYFLKSGAGDYIDDVYVRAAMVILTNALLKGVSGIRFEIIERYVFFINNNITPRVRELGSIGASGDLVPLSSVAGAVTGLADCFTVSYKGEEHGINNIHRLFGLERIKLHPKEGLALVNSTAMLTGIAAINLQELNKLFALSLHAHALMMQALSASVQPFDAFTHQHKPHQGQLFIAEAVTDLLNGSAMVRKNGDLINGENRLYQDRYSVRCIPQFLGPVVDGFKTVTKNIEVEANSVTDNPLIDMENFRIMHGGNFLGEYVAIGMDQVRNYIGLIAKHLDAQIAMLVMPEFNGGLPSSLSGNTTNRINMGLKGLQITGNSIMPLLLFYGNSIADKFPTHAEQFNQNINSQGFNSALLTKKSIDLFRKYVAISLIFAVQAVDLRIRKIDKDVRVKKQLSPATYPTYNAIRKICNKNLLLNEPLVLNDNGYPMDEFIDLIEIDIINNGLLCDAASPLMQQLNEFYEA